MVDQLTATKTSTLAYLDSLVLGSLSTLTPMQKYLETQRQYNAAVNKAMADPTDSAAASAAQSAATAFLTASQVINASSAAFIGDKSKVTSDMERLASFAGAQLTDTQRQLSALDKQTAGINQLNDTAAATLQAILGQGTAAPAVGVPSFDVQRYAAGSNASADTLVAEIKGMRAEMDALRRLNADMLAEQKLMRTDANRNAHDIVDATEAVGETVSKEVGDAVEQAAYRASNPTKVAPR
jgi:phage terminase Nu1 subunit (DNA packaging protein)